MLLAMASRGFQTTLMMLLVALALVPCDRSYEIICKQKIANANPLRGKIKLKFVRKAILSAAQTVVRVNFRDSIVALLSRNKPASSIPAYSFSYTAFKDEVPTPPPRLTV